MCTSTMGGFADEFVKNRVKTCQSGLKVDVRSPSQSQYQFGPFLLDPAERVLTRDGAPVPLTFRVFEMLLTFVRSPGRILTKDELLEAVWPGRYMEEGSLKQAIFTLRKVLSGSEDETQYIVTAPGRGYCFTPPVQTIPPLPAKPAMRDSFIADTLQPPAPAASPIQDTSPVRSAPAINPAFRYGAIIATLAVLVAGVILFGWNRNTAPLPAKPSALVIADFQNLTNDPALGAVLGKVLEIDLAQSPFLSLIPPQRVSETLRLMERPEDAALTPALAQEVCARDAGNAFLSGAVATVGSRFVVTLEARDCNSGKSLAQDKTEAAREEDVPSALDALAVRIREGLNESSTSIRQFDVPIMQATTSSFEALKSFSLGERSRVHGDNTTALPFYKRAVELDPSFALAYEQLGNAYFGLREFELGKTYYRRAFDLKDRTSENEMLRISANYYQRLGNFEEAARGYQLWTQTYPRDWSPWANLTNLLTNMARYDDAIAAGKVALQLNPDHYGPYSVLARAYKRATRFADAKAVGRLAIAKGFDSWDLHGLLYEIAFAEGDSTTMAAQVAKEKGKPTETWMLDYEALAAATEGQVGRSRALFAKAIEIAKAQGPDSREEVTAFYVDEIEMLAILGCKQEALALSQTAPGLDENEDAPLALAVVGNFSTAEQRATALTLSHPGSTEINDAEVPLAHTAIDLGQGNPDKAIAAVQPALPYEMRDFWTASLLGQAYLATKAPGAAANEYRKILAARGVDGTSPLYPLAYLGLARALRMAGRISESRANYEKLFAFWKDADADLPVLVDAKREYAQLPAQSSAQRM